MAKLYPPYINGTIPAFYHSEGTTKIVVPFTMNRGVAPSEVAGFALKIKTINGDVKGVVQVDASEVVIVSNASVTFSIDDMNFLVGQYYKVQLAYIDHSGVIGYYSTVGIIKCTTKPSVTIDGLEFGQINTHNYSYVGTYSQLGGDVTEKMYSCQFVLYDSDNNIIADSGERLHNTSFDNISYESHEEFLISQDLDLHKSYYIQFTVTTTNKLVVRSLKYRVVQRRSIDPDITADLVAGLNFNNGYVALSLADEIDPVISGTFLLSRASSKNNYLWEEIKRFDLHSIPPKDWSYRDYTIEQGISYKYSIQQYNPQGIYSNRIESNVLGVDFEDMFLYDGEKQLRIRFNPKVTTFKTDILEAKLDTIGSQFPFISRNGNVNYKEFALSGLITYLSDEAGAFMTPQELGLDEFSNIDTYDHKTATTNLLDYNIAAERIFKNHVLDWLNDGQVKLFKSPGEGNFIVRLMNVSLSPMDQLGRMLHTFTATAYEIAEFNADNLAYYNLIDPRETLETQTRWVTIDIHKRVYEYLDSTGKSLEEAIGDKIKLNKRNAISVDFIDMMPGAHMLLDGEEIQIGATGAYHYKASNKKYDITSIEYKIDYINEGQLTYGYLTRAVTIFGLINDIELKDVPIQQFVGSSYLSHARVWNSEIHAFEPSTNLFDNLNDVRTTVLNLSFLRAEKRPVETIYMVDNFASPEEREAFLNGEIQDYTKFRFYSDIYCTNDSEFDITTAHPLSLYRVRFKAQTSPYNKQKNYKYYVDANLDKFSTLTDVCIDPYNKIVILYNDDLFKFTINDETIDLNEIEKYFLKKHDGISIDYIAFNDGVIMEVSYSKQIKIFNVEKDSRKYPALYSASRNYIYEKSYMIDQRAVSTYNNQRIKNAYDRYVLELNQALDKYREENGLVK